MTYLPTLAEVGALTDPELADRFDDAVGSDREAALFFREELRHREAARRHAELTALLRAIFLVSVVGVIFLAWDAID